MDGTEDGRVPTEDDVVGATLALLERAGAAPRGLPTVRALHLPPWPFSGDKSGEFGALALADGSIGLAYLLLDGALEALARERPALGGCDALATARLWREADPARRAIGYAAVNALTAHLYRRAGYAPPSALDSIAGLAPLAGEHVGMVGFFPPLPRAVASRGARLTVLELADPVVGPVDGADARDWTLTTDPRALGDCDKVLLTSTTLLNGTLDTLLAHCRADATVAMLGPGAGCPPDALFARGVSRLCGLAVEEGEALLSALEAGTSWGRFTRKTCIERTGWPDTPIGEGAAPRAPHALGVSGTIEGLLSRTRGAVTTAPRVRYRRPFVVPAAGRRRRGACRS